MCDFVANGYMYIMNLNHQHTTIESFYDDKLIFIHYIEH